MSRVLSLTPAHIARIHREVPDTGPPPGMELHTDADYAAWVARIAEAAPPGPLRLFAYGSLIWKPEVAHTAETLATVHGWHRSFCLRMIRFRATPDCPGLMMVLDRGGSCNGVLYDLPEDDLLATLARLFRREFTVKPINSMPQWITVRTAKGPARALAFVMNRASPAYLRLSLPDQAAMLARACGPLGTGAEYLLNTVTHLKAKGIHDSGLWTLQRLVANQIDAAG
ncbi:MAG: gamma-glutamylcyclotransferase [Rhodobacterales bacterium 12-65-15]|nr:MAG: gamma-glutamylcyclotransferase [Rhodobacterales bacterium 12-65-15]